MRQRGIKMKAAAEKRKTFFAVTSQYKRSLPRCRYLLFLSVGKFRRPLPGRHRQPLARNARRLQGEKRKYISMDLPHGNQHMYHLAQAQRPLLCPQRTDKLMMIYCLNRPTRIRINVLEEVRELYRLISRAGDADRGADKSLARRKAAMKKSPISPV